MGHIRSEKTPQEVPVETLASTRKNSFLRKKTAWMGEEKVGTTRQYRALCHDKSSKYVWTHNGCYDKEIRCYEVVITN